MTKTPWKVAGPRKRTWLGGSTLAFGVHCLAVASAAAQTPPPRHDTKSPTGVSFRTVTFTYDEEDLSIGGPGQEGLSFRRSYSSNPPPRPGMFSGLGWTDNFATYVNNDQVPWHPDVEPPPANEREWIYNVSIGMKSYAFIGGTTGGTAKAPSHVAWGPYRSVSKDGVKLVYNGTDYTSGFFMMTEADGTIINFTPGVAAAAVSDITYPDGTRLSFTYSVGKLKSVFSNRGWGLLFESTTKACAVNLATTFVSATSSCPPSARSVTYGYSAGVLHPSAQLLTSVTKGGATETYGYGTSDHLSCIRNPGETACKIANIYSECPASTWDPAQNRMARWPRDPVATQTLATGEVYTYSTDSSACGDTNQGEPDYFPWTGNNATMTLNNSEVTHVGVGTGGMPMFISDPLNRSTTIEYESPKWPLSTESVDVAQITRPGGDAVSYNRDARGNIYRTEQKARPGSGLSDIVVTAVFPSACDNAKTCNKPTSVTDARSNTTSYTYDAAHGGVLTETGPAVNGIQPVKRSAYAQYYAWLKASGPGYAPAATPVWLSTEERTCRSTATVGNACAGGTADEVVVSYEYQAGNASTPSNLLLRGKVVTADGQSLRTCFGYDNDGNKIWETSPRAGLGSCQ